MSVALRVTYRAVMCQGKRVELGDVVRLPALEAAHALTTGRFELVDQSDGEALRLAVQSDTVRMLRNEARPARQPDADPRWSARI